MRHLVALVLGVTILWGPDSPAAETQNAPAAAPGPAAGEAEKSPVKTASLLPGRPARAAAGQSRA